MFDVHCERYASLATFRRNGKEVRTPVWFAADPGDARLLWVYTNGRSGKVKRIRAGSPARLAPCDARGKLHGDWVDVEARLVEGDVAQKPGFDALLARYGWQARLLLLGARLGGRWKDRAILALRL